MPERLSAGISSAHWRYSFIVFVGIREVAGFLFGLLFLRPHMIQLVLSSTIWIASSQRRSGFFLRIARTSFLQVLGDLDFALLELALHFLEFFSQLFAAMEFLIRLAEQVIVRDAPITPR